MDNDLDNGLCVEWVGVDDVHPNPANPRINDAAVEPLAGSIRRFGWQQPLVVKEDGEVVAGHTRLKAAKMLGMERIPIVRFTGSDIDAVAFGIADNKTASIAEFDEPALAKLLAYLAEEDALEGVGFSDEELSVLLQAGQGETEVEDEGPGEPPAEPVSRVGDLWILGGHRLLCGDSTSPEDMARLMDGATAALLATDPPYLVDYQGKAVGAGDEEWDEFHGEEHGVEFFVSFLDVALPHCRPDVAVYQWHAHRRQALVQAAWEKAGLLLHQQIIWTKARGTFGRSHFMWAHEPCFYGWPKGNMPPKERRPPASETTVWPIDQVGQLDGVHPTQKPLEVFLQPMRHHTLPGEVCLEPFSGSGSQIIAAEKLGRACRAMELGPGYVDVAIERWQWLGDFQRARSDKQLLDAREDLALMDVAIEKLLARVEELDSPSWREDLRETFAALQAAIRSKRQSQVSALMKQLGELIERGATIDQVASDLVVQIERRANRACRISEVELRKEEKITPSELAAVFRLWLAVLEKGLEPAVYFAVLPELRRATAGQGANGVDCLRGE